MPKTKSLDTAVSRQLKRLTTDNANLREERDGLKVENEALRKLTTQQSDIIENDLKADSIINIIRNSDYKQTELDNLSIDELQQIEATLGKAKGDGKLPYKTIRAGDASSVNSRLTVGNLYGKKREEILESGGDF